MSRMSKETQNELGLTDQAVDFDEFLQMDEGPEMEAFAKKHHYQRTTEAALKGLKSAKAKDGQTIP